MSDLDKLPVKPETSLGLTPRTAPESLQEKPGRLITTLISPLVNPVILLVKRDLTSIKATFSANQIDLEHANVAMREIKALQSELTEGLLLLHDLRKLVARDLEIGRRKLKADRQGRQ